MKTVFAFVFVVLLFSVIAPGAARTADPFEKRRYEMVERDIRAMGVGDRRVLDAMLRTPRHLFVDKALWSQAYNNHPLPIAEGQTISQPYVVALMTEAVNLKGNERVLEVGTGSGYQAAILAELVKEVFSMEIRKGLYGEAAERLRRLGYKNIWIKHGDGYFGWETYAPFDVIMVTASANHIPPPLIAQLKDGGRLIIPLGSTVFHQTLTLVKKEHGQLTVQDLGGVIFVPMTGEAQKK
jgi:protein-L-isoaspartate(D-aspartate) O-methyltransferase